MKIGTRAVDLPCLQNRFAAMSDLILHHYDFSNFAEKVRLALGFKGLAWHSVIIPPIAPKPDLVPLTGGYRRTPVLQVGADLYCDTRLIVRELERRFPAPTLFPPAQSAMADAIAYWAENRLMRPITLYTSGMNLDHLPAGLQADRSVMRGLPPPNDATMRRAALRNAPLVRAQLPDVESMLADGREWLAGPLPCVADLAVYHPLWFFTARTQLLAHELAPYPHIAAWMSRVRAFGHGRSTAMAAAHALEVARNTEPLPPEPSTPWPEDPPLGAEVRIRADDYGRDVVSGELVHAGIDEIVLRRDDPLVGTVDVHFPRLGYDLRAA
jgi:glutathione S-transferase